MTKRKQNNDMIAIFFVIISIAVQSNSIQSNSSCAPMPNDKRQLMCACVKQLQLRCTFVLDLREINLRDIDKSLVPVYYNQVSINRLINPYDYYDANAQFKQLKNNHDKVYMYFPNFDQLSSPFIRLTFARFTYVPSFAFGTQQREISAVVFELHETFDFGIDKHAFNNLKTESLLIEGPFNQMTIHQDAFLNAQIDELTIGCYCIECDTFEGDCKVLFNQKSAQLTENKFPVNKEAKSSIKKLKLYGVQLAEWNLDTLPLINDIERLDISNIFHSNQEQYNLSVEFKCTQVYPNLKEFQLKNSNWKEVINGLFSKFPNLTFLSLTQNKIEFVAEDAFGNNFNLLELHLENNKLKHLEPRMFNSLIELKVLNLRENELQSVNEYSFQSLAQLEFLDLSHNNLKELNENTFYGLKNLQQLIISFNPLKQIDTNTFKYLALESRLNKIELVSNSEIDWFVLDDSDICLLAHFKCETKIKISSEQKCNCFVKYLNLIEHKKDFDDAITENPCSGYFGQPSEMKNLKEESFLQKNMNLALRCSKSQLKKCFMDKMGRNEWKENETGQFGDSCLFKHILNQSRTNFNVTSNNNTILNHVHNHNRILSNNEASDISDISNVNKNRKGFKWNEELANTRELEWSIVLILIGMIALAIISLSSFFMAVYLMLKRNQVIYHTTESNYPPDER